MQMRGRIPDKFLFLEALTKLSQRMFGVQSKGKGVNDAFLHKILHTTAGV